jgi:hypothetical protein
MKKLLSIYSILFVLASILLFSSCKDEETIEPIVPAINPSQSTFNVDYKEGTTVVNFDSNVIFYATVNDSCKKWLSYKFTNNCKSLTLIYPENDTIVSRVGKIAISKGDTKLNLKITQAGNPNAGSGKLKKIDLANSIANSGGYTILSVTATESAKIPIGATVVLPCAADAGTISFINSSTYAEYAGGAPVGGAFSFVWTQAMATQTAGKGLMAMLRGGVTVTGMYCLYLKFAAPYTIATQGSYTILNSTATEVAKIPVGAVITLDCASDVGTVSFINSSTYAEYAGGAPVGGKVTFVWTKAMADQTAGKGIMAMLRGGISVTNMSYVYVKGDIVNSVATNGGYTILNVSAVESAKIPVGATVVFETAGDAGTISLINSSTYAEYAGGAPANGVFSFVWTKDMVTTTAGKGIMGILRGGFTINKMYYHN